MVSYCDESSLKISMVFLQVQQAQPQHPRAGTENPRPGREGRFPSSEHGAAAGETVRI